jgi:soluble lytic murein transglycosylase-like protein
LVAVLAVGAWMAAARLDSAAPDRPQTVPTAEQLRTDLALSQWLNDSWNSRQAIPSRAVLGENATRTFELFPKSLDLAHPQARSVPFGAAIHRAAQRYRLDRLLLTAIVEVESGFDARSVSPAGALGLMQIMPDIASEHGGDPFDPSVNLEVGARYFSDLLQRFNGDLALALAAYNAGPAIVHRYGKVPPYRETQAFVRRVLSIYESRSREEALRTTLSPVDLPAERLAALR